MQGGSLLISMALEVYGTTMPSLPGLKTATPMKHRIVAFFNRNFSLYLGKRSESTYSIFSTKERGNHFNKISITVYHKIQGNVLAHCLFKRWPHFMTLVLITSRYKSALLLFDLVSIIVQVLPCPYVCDGTAIRFGCFVFFAFAYFQNVQIFMLGYKSGTTVPIPYLPSKLSPFFSACPRTNGQKLSETKLRKDQGGSYREVLRWLLQRGACKPLQGWTVLLVCNVTGWSMIFSSFSGLVGAICHLYTSSIIMCYH